jgi:uncharacterized protein (TIGR00661 family)
VKKKILVAPLDWGLGHATRCIPIINELLKEHEVLIATSGLALPLLKQEFPSLTFFELPSYRARYSQRLPLLIKVFLQAPKFFLVIRQEHNRIEQLVSHHGIDVVISDNRYGCYSTKVKSIFVTHQLTILMSPFFKWLQPMVNILNHRLIKRFSECWVPDFETPRITGTMTASRNLKVTFVGMLSRFAKSNTVVEKKYDLLVLLSGPEPQRSVFENIVLEQLSDYSGRVMLVRGLPGLSTPLLGERGRGERDKKLHIENHLPAHQLQQAIEASELVLARSGYTTIMDLYFLKKKAIFVPTPGQTEQEYLATQLMKEGICFSCTQAAFDLRHALKEVTKCSGFSREANEQANNFSFLINRKS